MLLSTFLIWLPLNGEGRARAFLGGATLLGVSLGRLSVPSLGGGSTLPGLTPSPDGSGLPAAGLASHPRDVLPVGAAPPTSCTIGEEVGAEGVVADGVAADGVVAEGGATDETLAADEASAETGSADAAALRTLNAFCIDSSSALSCRCLLHASTAATLAAACC